MIDNGPIGVAVLLSFAVIAGCLAFEMPKDPAVRWGASVAFTFVVLGIAMSVLLYPNVIWQAVFWPFRIGGAAFSRLTQVWYARSHPQTPDHGTLAN